MNTLKPLKNNDASIATQQIFAGIQAKVGMLPNIYAAMGISDKLLGGYLNFVETLKTGEFSAKEYEAIALITSEINNCPYCISAHTTLGKMQGLSDIETIAIRKNLVLDKKLAALVNVAKDLVTKRGYTTEESLTNFINAGYSQAAFAELIAIVTLTSLTNYIHHNGQFEIDFPIAPSINKQVA